jgi:hypothetical protein
LTTSTEPLSGQCLCGAVAYTGAGGVQQVYACHCSECLRWSGGAFIGVRFAGSVVIADPAAVNWYASSERAERGSCRVCGSTLFHRIKADPAQLIVTAGSIDDQAALPTIEEHIFIDAKPAYYEFHDDAPRVTGAEVFERYSGGRNQ